MGEARRLEDRLRVLSHATRVFAEASQSSERLFDVVVREVAESLQCACMLMLFADDGEQFTTRHVHADDPEFFRALREHFVDGGPKRVDAYPGVKHVAKTGTPFFVPRLDIDTSRGQASPEVERLIGTTRLKSALLVPWIAGGRLVGALGINRCGDNAPLLDEHDLALAQSLAEHAALALVNSRLLEESQRANQSLVESETAHRLLFDSSPIPLFVFDVETFAPLAVNDAALRLYGYRRDEFMRLNVSELAADGLDASRARTAALGDREASGITRHLRRNGTRLVAEYTTRAFSFAGRRARFTLIKDITERHEAEQTRALLAAIVESANDAIVSKRLDGTITSWNSAAERLFGYAAEEVVGKPITVIVPPDLLDEERALLTRVAGGERIDHYETVRRRKDESLVAVSISIAPILDASGKVVGASKTARDLTAQRKADEALARTEEQLRQAQKMEAVGRLAGGVAHDFNNMLSVILSYSSMILGDAKPGDPTTADVEEIRQAALRATDLTRQLLMFSRQQIVEPRVLDLNGVLAGMDKMLQRILGEDIDLVSSPASGLGCVRVDPSHAEQVIMNLAVNARDAMPTGGKLTIEISNVNLDDEYVKAHLGTFPGRHVMLAVTDTGIGMDKATQARIFEPFFTTKEPGKGTGLGLSTVFGIAQRCGGSVWVYSEPGKGTTFKVYFPRIEAMVDLPPPSQAPVTLRGSETILLVEDQEQVRAVAHGILKRHGYRVIIAQNAGEALLLCEREPGTIHLLLTDVVMPRMSGAELAKRLAATRPEMRVLCMSGYTDDSIVRHGVLDSGMAFLQKPFTPESLTRKVRETLNGPRAERP